jgi:methionyl aminopeptidase
MITRRSATEIGRMERAGRVVAEILALVEEAIRPGVTTAQLDAIAVAHLRRSGATSSFLGYRTERGQPPFPATICTSIDDEVVHGIPGPRVVRTGMVISIDAGAIVDGYHGDAARTFIVGDAGEDDRRLVDATRLALMAGIGAARAGGWIGDISAAVEDVALSAGLGVVRDTVGHGIGTAMHEPPEVPNVRRAGRGARLERGMCIAIEPQFTLGSGAVRVDPDRWTIRTADGSRAAHFEHSIAITADGPRILTAIRG